MLTAFALLAVMATESSPLYSAVGRDYDMFVMGGEFLRRGKTLYVDYFDNKGPYLFLINALGLCLSSSKWGIFLLEVLNLTAVFALLQRLGNMLTSSRRAMTTAFIATIATLAFTIGGGDTVEMWSLPWVVLSLIFGIKILKCDGAQSTRYIVLREFAIGACFGIVAMLRINNAAILLGILITLAIAYIVGRRYRQLLILIAASLAGIVVAVMPAIIWMALSGGLRAMLYAIYEYAWHYKSIDSWHGWTALLTNFTFLIPCIALPIVAEKGSSRQFKLLCWAISIVTFLTFISGNAYYHYFTMVAPLTFIAVTISYNHATKSAIAVALIILLPLIALRGKSLVEGISESITTRCDNTQMKIAHRLLDSIPEGAERDSIYQLYIDSNYWGAVYRATDGRHLPAGRYIGQQGFHANVDTTAALDSIKSSFNKARPRYIISSWPLKYTIFKDLQSEFSLIDSVPHKPYNFYIYRRN